MMVYSVMMDRARPAAVDGVSEVEGVFVAEIGRWMERLDELLVRVGNHVFRREPRLRMREYVKALLGQVGRKNSWQLAEHAGHGTPDRFQRLLARAVWDPQSVRDEVRDYVFEHLGAPDGVLIVDLCRYRDYAERGVSVAGVVLASQVTPQHSPASCRIRRRPGRPL
jgi:SRSO17 transposase